MASVSTWHAEPLPHVLDLLAASERGLDDAAAATRLAADGPNELPKARPPSALRIFARQFRNPLIYILAAAAAVSAAIGETVDAGFIVGVLLLNAAIGGIQELRAERSSHALQQLLRTTATVVRGGEIRDVDAAELVRGDVIWLEPGQRVPADVRLLTTHALEVDESLLTGESVPVAKDASWLGEADATLGDRSNMAHAGSMVGRGRGKALVVATGSHTVVGKLAIAVAGDAGGKPPLLVRLERFTRVIGIVVLIAAALVGLIGVAARGYAVTDMFMFSVALAVSAIPEGLPIALTVALAVATARMARRGVIVRRLAAVEGLGSCTLIATDKTGTLTCNELTVRAAILGDGSHVEVTGEGYAPVGDVFADAQPLSGAQREALRTLAHAVARCNEATLHHGDGAWVWRGDPTDVALLSFAGKAGVRHEDSLDEAPEVAAIPFEPDRKYAATFHQVGPVIEVYVKGAPERVLEMCAWPSPDAATRWADQAREMAAAGQRVLGVAMGRLEGPVSDPDTPEEPSELQFLGLVGMIDPLRGGVREAIDACHHAGIDTTMITGDHPVTALAIARALGLASSPDQVISGADLGRLTEEELAELVTRIRVFARVSPDQKLDIVRAARRAGHFVAVTGDGVNDAPALRSANIGVAMGKAGTDVAREAAELVITDDNFATIVAGVEEGRAAYDNVRKVIYLLVSTGAAEVVMITLALIFGLPLPLLAVQLLWLNLVTNGIQDKALAFEPGDPEALDRPPRRPGERIFNRLMIERTLVAAAVMGGVSFAAFWWMLEAGWREAEARNAVLLLMVLFENVHIGNCRSETVSLLRMSPLKSPILLIGALAAFTTHVIAMHVPMTQRVLGTAPVSLDTWLVLAALALSVVIAIEIQKWIWRRRSGSPPHPESHAPARDIGAGRLHRSEQRTSLG
jgi:P-type Ca2+ transporter type 2C